MKKKQPEQTAENVQPQMAVENEQPVAVSAEAEQAPVAETAETAEPTADVVDAVEPALPTEETPEIVEQSTDEMPAETSEAAVETPAESSEVTEGTEPRQEATSDADVIDDVPAEGTPVKPKRESRRKRRRRAKKLRLLNITEEKDIRYRGFLSYRGVRILAWLCFLTSQVGILMQIGCKFDEAFANQFSKVAEFLPIFGNYMTPLFLIATFAIILNNSRKYSGLLVLYGGFSVVFYCLFILIHDRYAIGIVMKLLDATREESQMLVDVMLSAIATGNYIAFNVFIDLFLCTLFTFFMLYKPKKVFVGKWLIAFRLMAILPVAYEITCIVLKVLASMDIYLMSVYLYPLLTTKPPLTFLAFVLMTFFIKKRERLYRRNGKTREEYQAFLGTKLNSLHFSSVMSIVFVIVAIVDLILMLVLSAVVSTHMNAQDDTMFSKAVEIVYDWGFGKSTSLLVIIPVVMLFSYTRVHKDTRMDLIINLLGIIALVLIYVEGIYQGIINEIGTIKGMLEGVLGGMMG